MLKIVARERLKLCKSAKKEDSTAQLAAAATGSGSEGGGANGGGGMEAAARARGASSAGSAGSAGGSADDGDDGRQKACRLLQLLGQTVQRVVSRRPSLTGSAPTATRRRGPRRRACTLRPLPARPRRSRGGTRHSRRCNASRRVSVASV